MSNTTYENSSFHGEEGGTQELHPEQHGACEALKASVNISGQPGAATSGTGVLVPAKAGIKHQVDGTHWWGHYIPGLEKYASEEHLGNYVVLDRQTGEKQWESMPMYVRVGMSLLFATKGDRLLGYKYINHLLLEQSIKQGKLFDEEKGAYEHIGAFVKTYELESTLDQLLNPDLKSYKTFNSFFYRALKPDARPPASPEDPNVIVSVADCRLTVWEDVTSATEFWIKGRRFTVAHLVHDDSFMDHPAYKGGCALAIFRLAPQDYHRWHSPLSGVLGTIKCIAGALYTVNPMAVNNPKIDVFTANKRNIQILNVPGVREGEPDVPIPIVSIGAMLVGSITYLRKDGDKVAKGEEVGYFSYGGSTCIVIFPKSSTKFDKDLVKNSKQSLETVVKVGEHIGVRV